MVDWLEVSKYIRQYQSAALTLQARFGIPRERLDGLSDCRGDDGLVVAANELADLAETIEAARAEPVAVADDQ